MKVSLILPLFLFAQFLSLTTANAQSPEEEIKKTIKHLFDGMRTNDSAKVHQSFAEDVVFQRIISSEQGTEVNSSSFQSFLDSIGRPKEIVWNELIRFEHILIDGDMATVWTPYRFYLGEQFSHCGVNVFTLHKQKGQWKIFHLVDTSRKTGCPTN